MKIAWEAGGRQAWRFLVINVRLCVPSSWLTTDRPEVICRWGNLLTCDNSRQCSIMLD
jgi:hypothetical protein